jgi:hypothetical protein
LIVACVPPDHIGYIWPQAGPLLQLGIDTCRGRWELFDCFQKCSTREQLLWIVMYETNGAPDIVAAFVTEVIDYTRRRALSVPILGGLPGQMRNWLPLVDETLTNYGRDMKCQHIEGYGREAWLRPLSKLGWDRAFTVFEKEI